MAADLKEHEMIDSEPTISFEIDDGIAYTPERQRQVADCRRRANEDFIQYSMGKLQRDGTLAHDWPTHISVAVRRDAVSWSLVSKSGHRFSASFPERHGHNS